MVYECDQCSKALPAGTMACPSCGETFEDAVPLDAEDAVSVNAEVGPRGFSSASAQQCRQAHLVNRSSGSGVDKASAPEPSRRTAPSLAGIYLLLVVVAGLLAALVLHLPAQSVSAPHWEYMIQDVSDASFTDQMNDLGRQGWDVVSARRASDGKDVPTFSYEVILKRPKQ